MYYALSKNPLPSAFAEGAAVRAGLSFDRAVGIAMHSGVPPIERGVMR